MTDLATGTVTVADLREELVELGLTEEEANSIKGKSNLRAKIEELQSSDDVDVNLDNVEVVEDKLEYEGGETTSDTPDIYSPEWSDYVLGLMTNDEKIDGNPTVDGMRRVAQKLLGRIVHSASDIIQCPCPENKERATVKVSITFSDLGNTSTFSGCADSYWGNTDKEYRNHPVAVAETRAEGRALKRALRLRKVISAEENVNEADLEDLGMDSVGKITTPQIQYLEITCRDKLGLNIKKLVNKELPEVKNINDVSHAQALELFKLLSSYQSTGVPEELKGYDADWKSNLTGE